MFEKHQFRRYTKTKKYYFINNNQINKLNCTVQFWKNFRYIKVFPKSILEKLLCNENNRNLETLI